MHFLNLVKSFCLFIYSSAFFNLYHKAFVSSKMIISQPIDKSYSIIAYYMQRYNYQQFLNIINVVMLYQSCKQLKI